MNQDFEDRELPISGLKSPKLIAAYAYWLDRRGDRQMPARDDIRPEDMRAYLGHVTLAEVLQDPVDFRYRVFGSAIVQAHGRDFTGKTIREIRPDGLSDLILQEYLAVMAAKAPRVHLVRFRTSRRLIGYERLTMPLASDGQNVDMVLAVAEYEKRFWQAGDAPE